MISLFIHFLVFIGDYIDQSTQQIIHIYPNNTISLCKEVPIPWNQYIPYEIKNNTIWMSGAYGKLINNSETEKIEWNGTFESRGISFQKKTLILYLVDGMIKKI